MAGEKVQMNEWKVRLSKPWFPPETMQRVDEVLESGWVAGGELAGEFAARVAEIEGYDYGVPFNSCTSALQVALELSPDVCHRVRVPYITFPATVNAVLAAGLEPVITDYDFDMGVDLFGLKIGERSWAVGDCACSLGSRGEDSSPYIACYSFHARKLITTGEGGVLCTSNKRIAARAAELSNHGRHGGTFSYGYGMKMPNLNAAIGLAQINYLSDIIGTRWRLAALYSKHLPDGVEVFGQHGRKVNVRYNYQTFVVILPEDLDVCQIITRMREDYRIECNGGTAHLDKIPYYREFLDPHAEFYDWKYLALPLHGHMSSDDVRYVAESLSEIIEDRNEST